MATQIVEDVIATLKQHCVPHSSVLGPIERGVLAHVWERLNAQTPVKAAEGRAHLSSSLDRLEVLWATVEMQPSILRGQTLGGLYRDLRSLIDVLASCSAFSAEAFLPTRAALCRAFLMSKLNFCRLLAIIARELLSGDREQAQLLEQIERIQTSAVCDVMAEDLMRMIVSDETLCRDVRRRAARVLVQMWEYSTDDVVSSLFPVLDSAWQAKTHVVISYGALSGVTELLTMMGEGCDPIFVECFLRDDVSEDEEFALQEFVFNIPYERLQQIQHHIDRKSVV